MTTPHLVIPASGVSPRAGTQGHELHRKPHRMPSPQRSVPGWLARTIAQLVPSRSAPHTKASRTGPLLAFEALRQPVWAPRDYAAFAREGFAQNAIAYRCVRMVA